MKGCTITMPLEEYQKLEKYIKQIDTMDSYIQQIEALKGEIQSLKGEIFTLKDINQELNILSSGNTRELKVKIGSLQREIQSLKNINQELKWSTISTEDKIATVNIAIAENKFMEELWYYSQTGDYIPRTIQEQLENNGWSSGEGAEPDDLYVIIAEVHNMFNVEGQLEKWLDYIQCEMWTDFVNLATEGPDCILGCKNLEEFREKFLNYFRKDSFRKRYNLQLQKRPK